jgi:hypothetical protein
MGLVSALKQKYLEYQLWTGAYMFTPVERTLYSTYFWCQKRGLGLHHVVSDPLPHCCCVSRPVRRRHDRFDRVRPFHVLYCYLCKCSPVRVMDPEAWLTGSCRLCEFCCADCVNVVCSRMISTNGHPIVIHSVVRLTWLQFLASCQADEVQTA